MAIFSRTFSSFFEFVYFHRFPGSAFVCCYFITVPDAFCLSRGQKPLIQADPSFWFVFGIHNFSRLKTTIIRHRRPYGPGTYRCVSLAGVLDCIPCWWVRLHIFSVGSIEVLLEKTEVVTWELEKLLFKRSWNARGSFVASTYPLVLGVLLLEGCILHGALDTRCVKKRAIYM